MIKKLLIIKIKMARQDHFKHYVGLILSVYNPDDMCIKSADNDTTHIMDNWQIYNNYWRIYHKNELFTIVYDGDYRLTLILNDRLLDVNDRF